jgi:hypothetical protein
MVRTVLLAVASCALLAPPPPADTVRDLLAAAAKLRDEKPLDAAQLYGQAIAKSQSTMGMLALEEEAAEEFNRFAGRSRPGDVVAAVLAKLDPKRCGAFASAPLLAAELLLLDVVAADGKHVKEAAAVLANHRGGKSGAALKALAGFGEALRECREGDAAKAASGLKAFFDVAAAEEWTDLAIAAGIERVALRLRLEDAAGAAAAMGETAALATPKTPRRHLALFQHLVGVRLKDAPEAVLKPWQDAMGYMKQDDPGVGSAGAGKGAPGSANSAEKETPYGQAIRITGKWKNIATVTRTRTGHEVCVGWDPKFREEVPRSPGIRHVTEGGLTLALVEWSVALRYGREETDGQGAPGVDAEPDRWRPWYRLARGETWALGRDGVVRITGK